MTTHQRDLCRAINRHGQVLIHFREAKANYYISADAWRTALVVAAQQCRRWLALVQAEAAKPSIAQRPVFGVLHPTRADRQAFSNVE